MSTGQISLVIIFLTSALLLTLREWRFLLIGLAVQYIGTFLLISIPWSTGLAMVNLVVGWMAGAVLGISQYGGENTVLKASWPSSRIFRLLTFSLLVIIAVSLTPQVTLWFPGVSDEQIMAGILLLGSGLLQVALTGRPLSIIIGLLTILSGFEILYAAVEISVLVAGLLAGVNLGLALAGAYLLSLPAGQEAT